MSKKRETRLRGGGQKTSFLKNVKSGAASVPWNTLGIAGMFCATMCSSSLGEASPNPNSCYQSDPNGPPQDYCGGFTGNHHGTCFCDTWCTTYNDCCQDYQSVCQPQESCHDRCGGINTDSATQCSCEPGCTTNCCADIALECGGANQCASATSASEAWVPRSTAGDTLLPYPNYAGRFDYPAADSYECVRPVDTTTEPWTAYRTTSFTNDPGQIPAYMNAVKAWMAGSGFRDLINNANGTWISNFNAGVYPVYSGAWKNDRDPYLGSDTGQVSPPGLMYGLDYYMRNYAQTLYSARAACTQSNIFGVPNGPAASNGRPLVNVNNQPSFPDNSYWFPEGAVVFKTAAVATYPSQGKVFPAVASAPAHYIVAPAVDYNCNPSTTDCSMKGPNLIPSSTNVVATEVRWIQMDALIKDSVAAPETGWVFATFVYDANATGDAFDRMVLLGAQWGNNAGFQVDYYNGGNWWDLLEFEYDFNYPFQYGWGPSANYASNMAYMFYPVISYTNSQMNNNWINPGAPKYARGFKTLGWGGRMSGPIDVSGRGGYGHPLGQMTMGTYASPFDACNYDLGTCDSGDWPIAYNNMSSASSCLSCHGTAKAHVNGQMSNTPAGWFWATDANDRQNLLMPNATPWKDWFQERPGNVPMKPQPAGYNGELANDYDLYIATGIAEFQAQYPAGSCYECYWFDGATWYPLTGWDKGLCQLYKDYGYDMKWSRSPTDQSQLTSLGPPPLVMY